MPDNSLEIEAIRNHRKRKEAVVFTNGCFDILHAGHVRYLREARELGNVLVVGMNSDSSVARLKGPARPVVPQAERKELLCSLRFVDYVCLFDEDTPFELIQEVKPDILVKGGDWPVEKIVGADFVNKQGGEVLSLPYHEGYSTSDIIEKIRNSFRKE